MTTTRTMVRSQPWWSWYITMAAFSITLLFLIVTLSATPSSATNYALGVLLATDAGRATDATNQRIKRAVDMAMEDYLSGLKQFDPPLPNGTSVSLVNYSTQGTTSAAFLAALNAIQVNGVVGLIGPFFSDEAIPVATLGSSLQVPVFSGTVSSSDLSDKLRIPYFIRGRMPDVAIIDPLLSLLTRFGWHRVGFLGTDDVYGRNLYGQLVSSTLGTSTSIVGQLFSSSATNVTQASLDAWNVLLAQNFKVFILHALLQNAKFALAAAASLGILDNPSYMIIGTVDWATGYSSSPINPILPLRGMMAVMMRQPRSDEWFQWCDRVRARDLHDNVTATPEISITEGVFYDITHYYIQAIANVTGSLLAVNGPNLLKALQYLHYTGVTGPFVFDHDDNRALSSFDRIMNYTTQNWKSGTNLEEILDWNEDDDSYSSVTNSTIAYPGGIATAPRDGISVLDGDRLTPSYDDSLLILSFVVGLIACWCATILVEQVLYNVEKRLQHWTWLVACAITLGGPGVWALHVIGLTALSLPAVSVSFDPSLAVAALVVALVSSGVSLYFAFNAWKYNSHREPHQSATVAPLPAPSPKPVATMAATTTPGGGVGIAAATAGGIGAVNSGITSGPNSAAVSTAGSPPPATATQLALINRRSPTNPFPAGTFVNTSISPQPISPQAAQAAAAAAAVAAATGGTIGNTNTSNTTITTTGTSARSHSSGGVALAVPGAEIGAGESPPQRAGRTIDTTATHTPGASGSGGASARTITTTVAPSKPSNRTMLPADRSLMGQLRSLPRRVNMLFFIAALVQCIGSLATHWLLMLSLCEEAGQSTNFITSAINFVLGVWFYLAGLVSFFYFFPQSGIRSLGALVIHVANFVLHMTHMVTTTYTYSPFASGALSNTNDWTPRVIVLAISVATAVLCFVLLAVNVSRMKLSRNALDLIVIRFKKELASTLQRVEDANDREVRQRREKERLWKMVETINQCRPLHRDYALATALADYEPVPPPPPMTIGAHANNLAATVAVIQPSSAGPAAAGTGVAISTSPRDLLASPTHMTMSPHAGGAAARGGASFGATSPSLGQAPPTPASHRASNTQSSGGSGTRGAAGTGGHGGNNEHKFEDWELRPPRYRASSAMSIYQQLCSNIQLNGPIHDAVAREVKLEQIIRHPVTLELLKDAMYRDGAAEYIMLLLDIRRYKACTDGGLRSILSREIFDAFLARGAKYEVVLVDPALRSPLERMFTLRPGALASVPEEDGPTPLDLFSAIEDDLMRIIQTNHMTKFSCSPSFNVCALLLGRPQMRLRTAARHPTPPASPRHNDPNHPHHNMMMHQQHVDIGAIPPSAAAATAAALALERTEHQRGPSAYQLATGGGHGHDAYHNPQAPLARVRSSESHSPPPGQATAGFGMTSPPLITPAGHMLTTAAPASASPGGSNLVLHGLPHGGSSAASARAAAAVAAAAAANAANYPIAARGPRALVGALSPTPLYHTLATSPGGSHGSPGGSAASGGSTGVPIPMLPGGGGATPPMVTGVGAIGITPSPPPLMVMPPLPMGTAAMPPSNTVAPLGQPSRPLPLPLHAPARLPTLGGAAGTHAPLPPMLPHGLTHISLDGHSSGAPVVTRPPSDDEHSQLVTSTTTGHGIDEHGHHVPDVSPPFAIRNLRGGGNGGNGNDDMIANDHGMMVGTAAASASGSGGSAVPSEGMYPAQSLLIGSVTSGVKAVMDGAARDAYDEENDSGGGTPPGAARVLPPMVNTAAPPLMMSGHPHYHGGHGSHPNTTSSASLPPITPAALVLATTSHASLPPLLPHNSASASASGSGSGSGSGSDAPLLRASATVAPPTTGIAAAAAPVVDSNSNGGRGRQSSLTGDGGHAPLLMSPSAALSGLGMDAPAPSVNRHPGHSAIYNMGPDL